ncbi:ElyC/SanA/YdcF family protein [uncultured Halomonas sp.]|uniref:ElyC/SanA/YdcF family protein n=1 Tax=uncultured Halomonas sp. TaxID=173971 RepID=UPI00262F8BB5|nr:ElyC/SanA/YdcF family protein [uncultured Halomonas sp.]
MPLPIILSLVTLGLFLASRHRRLGLGVVGGGLLLLLLVSWPPVTDRLLAPLEQCYPALMELPNDDSLAAVVVLGGGWQPEAPRSSVGRLSDSSAIRLMEGVRLWRQRPELLLMVSGASSDSTVPAVAKGYTTAAMDLGVPEAQLRLLDWPTDTGQEAQAVRDELGEGARIVLVTSASHMPRAMRHFQRAGLDPVAAPTHYLTQHTPRSTLRDWVPSASELRKTERVVYEALGLLAVRWEQP